MKTKLLTTMLAAALVIFGLTACNSSSGSGEVELTYTQIVTVSSMTDRGTVFTFVDTSDKKITLTTAQTLNTDQIKEGERIVIMFTLPDGDPVNGMATIELKAFAKIVNGELKQGTSEEYDSWRSQDIQTPAFWMSGDYLNASMTIPVYEQPKTLSVVVDESTLGEKYPTVHLIFEQETVTGVTWRTAYASFNMSWLWMDNTYEGFTLRYNTEGGFMDQKFTKAASTTPIQPGN